MKPQQRITTQYRNPQRKLTVPMAVSLVLAGAAQLHASLVTAHDAGDVATTADGSAAMDADSSADSGNPGLQEVTVTANRRAETVLEVPYNISAVTGADLKNSGAVDVQSLSTMVPGLQAPNGGLRGSSLPQFTIRGLNVSPNGESSSVGGEAPLVSIYSDNTPLEANLKMTDIARVEVLRGPQSTLYGSGAVGGTVRLIHNQPDTTSTEFDVTVDASKTEYSGSPSGSIDAIFNIPISDVIAVRGSVGWEGQSGFTDARALVALDGAGQPVLADPGDPVNSGLTYKRKNDINDGTVWYGRLAGLYRFSDSGEATLTYQHQQTVSGGYPYEEAGTSYAEDLTFRESMRDSIDLASLDLSQDFGFATVSSTTSYTNQLNHSTTDLTGLIETLNPTLYGNYPRVTSPIYDRDSTRTITQELRLASNGDGPLKWVAGMWYSDQKADTGADETMPGYAAWTALAGSGCSALSEDADCGATMNDVLASWGATIPAVQTTGMLAGKPADGIYYNYAHTRFHDFSPIFGELSWHITPKWQVTGGGRYIIQRFSDDILQMMPVCGAFCSSDGVDPIGVVTANAESSFHKAVFKANTSYEIAPDTLLYYTWSQGFRRGGANGLPVGNCSFCVPDSLLTYKPDLAVNNEVGIKGRIGKVATYSFTLFDIDWQNPQISTTLPPLGLSFIANADKARSRGLESELAFQLNRYTHLSLGYAYTQAQLTADFNIVNGAAIGVSGDALPGVSRQQASGALDFDAPLKGDLGFHAHADASFRSGFWTETPSSADATLLPGYTMLNLRSGISIGDQWRVDAYLSNVTGTKGISAYLYTAGQAAHNFAYTVAQPRTVGIQVNYSLVKPK